MNEDLSLPLRIASMINKLEALEANCGLTKRELFAAMAITGLMANPYRKFETIAVMAVEMADCLLAELQRTQGGENGRS